MKKPALLLWLMAAAILSSAQQPGPSGNTVLLPNGWTLSPAGHSVALGDLPLNMVVSASRKFIAVTNNGQSDQSVQLIDAQRGVVTDSMPIPKSWYGLAFADGDKTLYASGGNDNRIYKYAIIAGKLRTADTLILGPVKGLLISPAGLAVDNIQKRLYVVTKESNRLYVFSTATKQLLTDLPLGGEGYTCLLSPDRKTLYVSCWGCDQVKMLNTQSLRFTDSVKVGDNPNELCLDRTGNRLFVANANDNSVSIINTQTKKVTEVLNAALYPDALPGSTTNGLALSDNGKTLYIANADNNCLAVFDVSVPGRSRSTGFIPVGWYPTNVKVIGQKIFVTNGKGNTSLANPAGPNPVRPQERVVYQRGDSTKPLKVQYIAGLFRGSLSMINVPSETALATYTAQVYRNTPYNQRNEPTTAEAGNPIPRSAGEKSPIKYVFYIIKENRTYDQVLSDIPGGAGDTSLLLFGEKITPNHHALARQFVLLDNFYCNAEVSADGHNWSLGAYATDYLEKTWPSSYGGRGGKYDGEGNRAIANNKGGFIWDVAKRAGVSYRSYGEFADDGKANIPALVGNICNTFTGWNMAVPDTTRFRQWKHDFDSLLAIGKLPQLNTLRFPNDHTEGLRKGKPTPYAHMADNDLAIGWFIEHLSKSPIWKESAVFMIEDDAQNGADHIDAHRTTAYVAGGFVKRGFVDHTMYSTTSMVRTIELILSLPPMSQYDAAATPMWRCFTSKVDTTGFTALPSNVNLNEKNVAVNEWQRRSEAFNLSKEDAVPDLEFNIVLWHGLKGSNVPFPSPRRAAFVKLKEKEEEEDEDD